MSSSLWQSIPRGLIGNRLSGSLLRALGLGNDHFEQLLESYASVEHPEESIGIEACCFAGAHQPFDCLISRQVVRLVQTLENDF